MRAILCRFSSLDDIPKRKRTADNLLAFFKETGVRRVSTFEMDDKTMSALKELEARGEIRLMTNEESPYPWHGFVLIERARMVKEG